MAADVLAVPDWQTLTDFGEGDDWLERGARAFAERGYAMVACVPIGGAECEIDDAFPPPCDLINVCVGETESGGTHAVLYMGYTLLYDPAARGTGPGPRMTVSARYGLVPCGPLRPPSAFQG